MYCCLQCCLHTSLCRIACSTNQADAGEEEDAAQNKVDDRGLSHATVHEVFTAHDEANKAEKRQDDTKNAFEIHTLSELCEC